MWKRSKKQKRKRRNSGPSLTSKLKTTEQHNYETTTNGIRILMFYKDFNLQIYVKWLFFVNYFDEILSELFCVIFFAIWCRCISLFNLLKILYLTFECFLKTLFFSLIFWKLFSRTNLYYVFATTSIAF